MSTNFDVDCSCFGLPLHILLLLLYLSFAFFCVASSGKVLIYIIMPVLFMLRETFQYAVLGLSLVCTWLGFIYPVANAFVLMAFGAPFLFMLFAELKR